MKTSVLLLAGLVVVAATGCVSPPSPTAQPNPAQAEMKGCYYAGELLRAVRRPDGSVSHLDLGSFVFTRQPYDEGAPVPGGVDAEGWRGIRWP